MGTLLVGVEPERWHRFRARATAVVVTRSCHETSLPATRGRRTRGQRPKMATLPSTSKRHEQAESPKLFQEFYLSTISFFNRIPNCQRSSELALRARSLQ